jgi:putative toxin-antitoxin system antitoxin component (TIGR02293 family)
MSSVARDRTREAVRWTGRLNRIVGHTLAGGSKAGPVMLLSVAGANDPAASITFDQETAERVVRAGLKASAVQDVADTAQVKAGQLIEYLGIDRSTVKRKVDRDEALDRDASEKVLRFVELTAAAADVFGGIEPATRWLTRPHPMFDGETPLQRARTTWGTQAVRSVLNAIRYGGVV